MMIMIIIIFIFIIIIILKFTFTFEDLKSEFYIDFFFTVSIRHDT
jgi:hypothetical protein